MTMKVVSASEDVLQQSANHTKLADAAIKIHHKPNLLRYTEGSNMIFYALPSAGPRGRC